MDAGDYWKDAAEDASKPLPVGYQPLVPHLCIFVSGTSLSKSGPAYHGIPREACVVEEKEAAAIVARWKGTPYSHFYRLAAVEPHGLEGPWFGPPIASFETVHISEDGMLFSGGTHNERKQVGTSKSKRSFTVVVPNTPYKHKLVLRRGADGELYLDNFGSRVLEDSPAELRIELYHGGKFVLTKA